MATSSTSLVRTLMLDLMDDMWARLESIVETDIPLALDWEEEHEIMFLSNYELLKKKSTALKKDRKEIRGQLAQSMDLSTQESAEYAAYCILGRSNLILRSFVKQYRQAISEYRPTKHLEFLKRQLQAVEDSASGLITKKSNIIRSVNIVCNNRDCGDDGHFHSDGGRVRLPSVRQLEHRMPLPSFSKMEFRNFDLITPTYKAKSSWCFPTLLEAIRKSLEFAGLEAPRDLCWNNDDLVSDCENDTMLENLAGCLSYVTHVLAVEFADLERRISIGIILPGGSQVFYPSKINRRWAPNAKTVYIRANFETEEGMSLLTFVPVKTRSRSKKHRPSQTVKFEDLPAEIRNMIYGLVLDDLSCRMPPRKQPALALTSRLVNKEIMSLLFQKYGWFVRV